ncbi:MAG: hypothetical protein ACRCT8_16070 [Lacipirellulaceae bacterium]
MAVCPYLAAVAANWRSGGGLTGGDYAQYLLHAQTLWEGRPYGDIGWIFTPLNPLLGPVAEPPGLPLLVNWTRWVCGGDDPLAVRPWLVAFGAAYAVLAGWWAGRRWGLAVGFGVALLTPLSWELVLFSAAVVNSDLPLAAALWGLIVVGDTRGRWGPGRTAVATALAIAAIAFRTPGVAALPALFAFWLVHRRSVGHGPLVAAAAGLGAFYPTHLAIPVLNASLSALPEGFAARAWRAAQSAAEYRLAFNEAVGYPLSSDLGNDVFHAFAAVLCTVGFVTWVRRDGCSLAACLAACYAALLLAAPLVQTRYAWPLFPFLLLWVLLGIDRTALALGNRSAPVSSANRWHGVPVALASCALAIGLVAQGARQPEPLVVADHPEVRLALAFAESLAAKPDARSPRVLFFRPRILTLKTGVPAMGNFVASPADSIAELTRLGITHVFVGNLGVIDSGEGASIARAVEANPAEFEPVFEGDAFRCYRFRGAR